MALNDFGNRKRFLKVLMLLSLQIIHFAFFFLKPLGLIANALLSKGLFGSLNEFTGQIVLQPHGTNSKKNYPPIGVFSTLSILPSSLTL